jgi:TonB dependent receptor
MRVGVDYLRQISTQLAPADNRGTLTYGSTTTFSSLANFVDNFGGSGNINRVFGSAFYNPTLHRVAVFAQDRWKVSDSLTLTAGVRYENFGTSFNTLRTPAYTGLFNVDPVTRRGPFSEPNSVAPDNNNVAPSIGFAFSPSYSDGIGGFLFGERRTVIRAGYNIGYDSFFNNIASNAAASSPNQVVTLITSTVTGAAPRGLANFSSFFPTVAGPVVATSAQTLIAPNLVNPYYQRWSFGMQRELPFKLVMDVSYVGSKGTKLYINEDANPLVRAELRVTPLNPTTGLPVIGSLTNRLDNIQGARTVRTNGGDSNYNAGQIEVRRRFSGHFLLTGAYTFSKTISNQDEVFGIAIGSNTSFSAIPVILGGGGAERAVSSFDRTHRASFTYVIESPFFDKQQGVAGKLLGGFQLSGVTIFESGVPYTVFNGFDADGNGGGLDRPTYNPNGQRGVRAVPVVNATTGAITFINPEIVVTRNAAGTPLTYAPIDPNTAQFIVNPAYVAGLAGSVVRIGNLGRNTERSVGTNTTDLTVLKRTKISERRYLEARVEFFNAFNKPQYTAGTSTANALTQGLFLQAINPTTSGGGRVVRYQVKFVF